MPTRFAPVLPLVVATAADTTDLAAREPVSDLERGGTLEDSNRQ